MASSSTSAMEVGQKKPKSRLDLSDCICPICLYIFIEPVTMPCGHELCVYCFKKNVQEASLACPMCRLRISTWARRAVRHNKLVNQERWAEIQQEFPEKVQKRLLGIEDEELDEQGFVPLQPITPQGEIQKEYENQVKQLQQEASKDRLEEEEASMKLIQQLQEQEKQATKERERISLSDEAMAKELAVLPGATPDGKINSEKRKANSKTPTFMEKYLKKNKDSIDKESFPYKYMKSAKDEKGTTLNSIHPSLSTCSMTDVLKEMKSSHSVSSPGPNRVSPLPPSILNSSQFAEDAPLLPQLKPFTGEDKVSFLIDPDEDSLGFSSVQIKQAIEESKRESAFNAIKREPPALGAALKPVHKSGMSKPVVYDKECKQRSSSTISVDSMSQEMVHFKPIDRSPRTPPRRLASGELVDPPVVRSTPRNISNLVRGPIRDTEKEEEILGYSPIMKRKLTELKAERKRRVQEMSKATCTAVQIGDSKNERTLSPSITFLGEERPVSRQSYNETRSIATSPEVIDLCDTPSPMPGSKSVEVVAEIIPGRSSSSDDFIICPGTSPRSRENIYRMKRHSKLTGCESEARHAKAAVGWKPYALGLNLREETNDHSGGGGVSSVEYAALRSGIEEGGVNKSSLADNRVDVSAESHDNDGLLSLAKKLHGRHKSSESALQAKGDAIDRDCLKCTKADDAPKSPDLRCPTMTEKSVVDEEENSCGGEKPASVKSARELCDTPDIHTHNSDAVERMQSSDVSLPVVVTEAPNSPVEYSPDRTGSGTKTSEKKTGRKGVSAQNRSKGKCAVQTKLSFEVVRSSDAPGDTDSLSPRDSPVQPTKTKQKRRRNKSAKSASSGKKSAIDNNTAQQPHSLLEIPDGSKRRRKNSTQSSCHSSSVASDDIDQVRLERSDFGSAAEYNKYIEEQDRLLALKLQADFDRESKYRMNSVRRREADGEYELRRKRACRSAVC